MFKDKKCVLIGSGSSIRVGDYETSSKELPIWNKIKNCFTIGINWSFLYHISTVHLYSDYHFYHNARNNLIKLPLVITKQDGEYGRLSGKHWLEMNKFNGIYLLPGSSKYNGKD